MRPDEQPDHRPDPTPVTSAATTIRERLVAMVGLRRRLIGPRSVSGALASGPGT
jgi:hypothetical protein